MAEGSTTKKGELIGTWGALIYLVFQTLAVIVIIPNSYLEEVYKEEGRGLYEWFGEEVAEEILFRSFSWYETAFIDTGIAEEGGRLMGVDIHEEYLAGEREAGLFQSDGIPFFAGRAYAISMFFYLMFERISQILAWLPYIALVAVPCAIDGFFVWKAKKYSYSYASPWTYRVASACVKGFMIFLVIMLLVPFAVPPMLLPIMAVFLSPIVTIALMSHLPGEI